MPELPEVETMVRGIRPVLEGARLVEIAAEKCRCRPLTISPNIEEMNRRSCDTRVIHVSRRAKRILIGLSNSCTFVIEPRMTGLMLTGAPPTLEHLRLQWRLTRNGKRSSIWFWDRRGLGTVRLMTSEQLDESLGPGNLGPDALEITPREWEDRLGKTDRAVKVAMLDQKLVAGIGNLYASEILHHAGIHPAHKSSQLTGRQIQKLYTATREILQEAIRYEGSTLSDGTYRNALNHDGGYQNQHRVYDKSGTTCTTCGRGTILRIVQAQRSSFFCPRCQKSRLS